MAKAVLVVRMPESCSECILCKKMEDGCDYCMASNKIIIDISLKKYSCPLKPMPEKENICGKYNSEYYANGGKMPSWKCGWNACIDAICGKE